MNLCDLRDEAVDHTIDHAIESAIGPTADATWWQTMSHRRCLGPSTPHPPLAPPLLPLPRQTMSQPVYPNAADRLRRRQLNWMLRRGVVRAAEEKLALRESRLTGGKGRLGCLMASTCF